MKKYLSVITFIAFCSMSFNKNQPKVTLNAIPQNNTSSIVNNNVDDEDFCTMVYVGKEVSANHMPIIARSVDAPVTPLEGHLKIYKRNELANKTFIAQNGFTYTYPSHTAKCVVVPINANGNFGPCFDNCGVNEYGVAITATLTCHTNQAIKNQYDPGVDNGISEESIVHVILPTVKSAREGAALLCDIVEKSGNHGEDGVLIADQKEVWYAELYTGHQAVAVKLPEDKMFVLGNEFGLHTLTSFAKDDVIQTSGLISLPKEKGFIEPKEGDIDLFKTYARDLVKEGDEDLIKNNNSHRRTWRGLNLYGNEHGQEYVPDKEYDFMFTPTRNPLEPNANNVDVKLSINDVEAIFRDRFEDILKNDGQEGKPLDPNHIAFKEDFDNHILRFIACERSVQVHIIQVDPNVDKSLAGQMWVSMSPARFSPFTPINSCITSASKSFLYVSPSNTYDDKSAYWICKRLNTIATIGDDTDKYPTYREDIDVADGIKEYENIWQQEYQQVLDYAAKMKDVSKRNQLLTNYCTKAENEALELVKGLTEDSLLYFMSVDPLKDPTIIYFFPLVNLENYVKKFGYSYKRTKQGAIISLGKEIYELTMPDGTREDLGQIKHGDIIEVNDLHGKYRNNKAWIDFRSARYAFAKDKIAPVNINSYLPKDNILPWLLPTTIVPPVGIGGGLAFYFLYVKKRKVKIAIK